MIRWRNDIKKILLLLSQRRMTCFSIALILSSAVFVNDAFSVLPMMQTPLDLGDMQGKTVSCEANVIIMGDSQDYCKGEKSKECTHVFVGNCKIVKADIQRAYCYTSKIEPQLTERYKASNPINLDSDVIYKEMFGHERPKNFNTSASTKEEMQAFMEFKHGVLKQDEQVRQEIEKRLLLRPKVKITGKLEECKIPVERYESVGSYCSLDSCQIEFMDGGINSK